MLLAYLEGQNLFIQPDYKYALRSVWREQLLLEAITKKCSATNLLNSIHQDLQYVPVMKLDNLPEFAKSLQDQTKWLHKILMMDLNAENKAPVNRNKNLVKIYNTLSKSGILD